MADEKDPIADNADIREELLQVLGQTKALLQELKEQKTELIDGSDGHPSLKQEMITARDEVQKASTEITQFYNNLHNPETEGAKAAVEAVPEAVAAIKSAEKEIKKIQAKATAFREALFGDEDTGGTLKTGITAEVEEKVKQLKELHSKIFDKPDPNQIPLAEQVGVFLEDFTKKKGEIEKSKAEIEEYEQLLLGYQPELGEFRQGIQGRVSDYVSDLKVLVGNSTKRQEELLAEVEKLLEGASTAALATASEQHKTSFQKVNETWMKVFIGSVVFIMAVPLLALVWPSMFSLPWWEQLLVRLPLVGGAVTLAWYASKQRSQNKRLQQEYAYKEDVAKIYYALKKEIENLGESELGRQLREEVIKVLIKSVEFNPSSTLDSKAHNDGGPMQVGFEKGLDTAKDIAKVVVAKAK